MCQLRTRTTNVKSASCRPGGLDALPMRSLGVIGTTADELKIGLNLPYPNLNPDVSSRFVFRKRYEVVLVSPRNYFLYTPLLPAVATGTMEERSIVEPIRHLITGKVRRQKQLLWKKELDLQANMRQKKWVSVWGMDVVTAEYGGIEISHMFSHSIDGRSYDHLVEAVLIVTFGHNNKTSSVLHYQRGYRHAPAHHCTLPQCSLQPLISG